MIFPIKIKYFGWLCDKIANQSSDKYKLLLNYLDQREFIYYIPLDGNRFEDGIDLRYRFGDEKDIHHSEVQEFLDNKPCSILEMMVALSLRCENQIMTDDEYGDRTSEWFWQMINSLGLYDMTDENFDRDYVDDILKTFLDRKYEINGRGGLFTLRTCKYDVRALEIWYQAMLYLDEVLEA